MIGSRVNPVTNTETKAFPLWIKAAMTVAFLALLAGGVQFYRAEKSAAQQQAEKQLASIAHLKMDQIVSWRNARLNDAAVLTESPFLAEGISRYLADPNSVNTEDLRRRFLSIQGHYNYTDVLLVESNGRVRLSLSGNTETLAGFTVALADSLRERKPVLTDLHTEPQHPEPHISVVAPIFSSGKQSGSPLGAIVLIYNASQSLYPLVQSWPIPTKTAEILLVRRDQDSVLFLNDLRHHPGAALKLRIPLSRTEVPAVLAVLGKEGLLEGKDYQGVESMAVILPIRDSPWFLIVKDSNSEIFAAWHSRAVLILMLLAALTGGLAALVLVAWQYSQKKTYYQALYHTEAQMRASIERHSITLKAVDNGVIATDAQGRVELLNPVAEALTGWSYEDAYNRPLDEVFYILNEQTREKKENPVTQVLREGLVVGLANHTLLIAKNGIERHISDSAAPIRDAWGKITGVVLVFRDETDERHTQLLLQTRHFLQEYALDHTLEELLSKTLDEVGILVNSPIGFYHFFDADQKKLSLQQWSPRTLKEFCRAEGRGKHYDLDQAGVWADCVREKKPVIHNNYATLPNKHGLPEGHAVVVRELVLPVMRAGEVVAILGVGNKPEDYTEKDVEIVSYIADVTWQLIEQKQEEEKLLLSEQRYRTLYQRIMDAFVVVDSKGRVMNCNEPFSSMLDYTEKELRKLRYADITPEKWQEYETKIVKEQIIPRGYSDLYEKEYLRKDGTVVPVELKTYLIVNDEGHPEGMSAVVRDISERKRAEEERNKLQAQLNQAQKMESIGRLAGGVAHDFNNMLGIILGYAGLSLAKLEPFDPLRENLQEIFDAAKRSADIVRQLLAFARKQTIAPQVLDLNLTVEGLLKMLRHLIGEDINLTWLPGAGLAPIKIDPSQMDQLLANLCVNSRDAIKGVGKITVNTSMVTLDEAYCADHVGFIPGNFALLTVSDDGCGMDKETLGKIFEPFFTTKEMGQGTGLGLATVYGIVKQNNGFINVYSEPGHGTVFNIYLPCQESGTGKMQETPAAPISLGHGETILVVEDEVKFLNMTKNMLERLGYVVLTANTPHEAMQSAKTPGKIHLLIIDAVMPEMNGRELADQIHTLYPDIKTLFMSGYTTNVIAHQGILDEGVHFIHKPFSQENLAAKVAEVLKFGS